MALLCPVSTAHALNFRKQSPLVNKGDIFVRTATRDVALPVGANGQILSADSSTVYGLKWINAPSSSGTVSNSGTLTANAVIIGAGTTVVSAITADTSTTHFLAATAGAPSFRQPLSSDVTGVIGENNGGTGKTTYNKGDLLAGNAGASLASFPVGANGTVLSADSSQTYGLKWVAPPTGGAGGTPANPPSSIQYNNAGNFGGASLISTDGVRLAIGPATSPVISLDVNGSFRNVPVTLSEDGSILINAAQGNYFTIRLTGNRTLANPTNGAVGQRMLLLVSQDNTGSRKLLFGTAYKFGTDVPSYDCSATGGFKDYILMNFSTTTSVDVVGISKGFR